LTLSTSAKADSSVWNGYGVKNPVHKLKRNKKLRHNKFATAVLEPLHQNCKKWLTRG
jgi:hypothetical protein